MLHRVSKHQRESLHSQIEWAVVGFSEEGKPSDSSWDLTSLADLAAEFSNVPTFLGYISSVGASRERRLQVLTVWEGERSVGEFWFLSTVLRNQNLPEALHIFSNRCNLGLRRCKCQKQYAQSAALRIIITREKNRSERDPCSCEVT